MSYPTPSPYFHMPEVTIPILSGVSLVYVLQIYLNNTLYMLFLDFLVLDNTACLAAMENVDLILFYLPFPHTFVFPPHLFLSVYPVLSLLQV